MTSKNASIDERRKYYKDIAEAEMFERDVRKSIDEYKKHYNTHYKYAYDRRPCLLGVAVCIPARFTLDYKCPWEIKLSEEGCWIFWARLYTESLWEVNGRGL